MTENQRTGLLAMLRGRPRAAAHIAGSGEYPDIFGRLELYPAGHGTLVAAELWGLPRETGPCGGRIFAFHIHSGGECAGNGEDPFADALGHFDPAGCPHPRHAGDMPPLFGSRGHAFLAFLTDRFTVGEVVGRTVIVHAMPDDFTTQPSGAAGKKIACGVIRKI